ncbi:unnamed protein product [Mycena citricolor]|uniref:Aldolase n=1 Tax=Mycena citricolor TaxID=2018698 RepID=A0AAD2H3V0_9AGAR|nr:unnamed protein product [Mycena citricolor]
MSAPASTLLEQIRSLVTVDLDAMDPDIAARLTQQTKFCDMTSNQAIVHGQATRPERALLLKHAVEYAKQKRTSTGPALGSVDSVQDAIDVFTVLLAKEVLPYLTGNVHAQTSPSTAYDKNRTISHAKKLVQLFSDFGIPSSRVCIKIPATPESLLACRDLQNDGIQTLATCLFSVPQAVAASQAGCVYVAPYFNELRVHFQEGLWHEYADTKNQHPMCQTIMHIRSALREIGSKTLVMPASIVTVQETIALASLSPDHLTISGHILDLLSTLPAVESKQFDAPKLISVDFPTGNLLDNDGTELRRLLDQDLESQRKLTDALLIFNQKEAETKSLILNLLTDP